MGYAVFMFFLACFAALRGYAVYICLFTVACTLAGAYRCHRSGRCVRGGALAGLKLAALTIAVLLPIGITMLMASEW